MADGILFDVGSAYQELKQATHRGEDSVGRARFYVEIGSEFKKEGGLEGLPISLCLLEVAIKGEKVGSLDLCPISEALAMSDIFIDGGGQKTLKGFH
jgi:hypothetical protein